MGGARLCASVLDNPVRFRERPRDAKITQIFAAVDHEWRLGVAWMLDRHVGPPLGEVGTR